MTTEEALLRLATSSGQAALGVLRMLCGDAIEMGPAVVDADASPLATIAMPAVAVSVSYVDGAAGGNVFVLTPAAARELARTMLGEAQGVGLDSDESLSEIERSAIGEAMNQIMAAAAAATASALRHAIEISTPQTRLFTSAEAAAAAYDHHSHAVHVPFALNCEPAPLA